MQKIEPYSQSLVTGLFLASMGLSVVGISGLVVSVDRVFSGRSGALEEQAKLEEIKREIENQAEARDYYEAHELYKIDRRLHLINYRCDSGKPPHDPSTNSMVIDKEVTVVDAAGRIAGWITYPEKKFELNENCLK